MFVSAEPLVSVALNVRAVAWTPVAMPLSYGVRNNKLGARP